jgi:hypothetical protein
VNQKPARPDIIVLKHLLNFTPRSVINQTAHKSGVDTKVSTFSVLSHLASMLFAQLSHAISLNDVCDWLRLKTAAVSRLQIVTPSHKNFSHANKVHSADFSERLFWSILKHLQNIQRGLASDKNVSISGSMTWSISQAKTPHPQRKAHGTASAQERKCRLQKLQLPRLKFRRPLFCKSPLRT